MCIRDSSVDVKRVDGAYHVFAKGGREDTGLDAIEWIKRGEAAGAGEIVVNSIDTDGVKEGFDIEMLKAVNEAVSVPVIASGGAGCIQDFIDLFRDCLLYTSGNHDLTTITYCDRAKSVFAFRCDWQIRSF